MDCATVVWKYYFGKCANWSPAATLSAAVVGSVSAVLVAAVANDQSGAESRDVLLTAVCWGGDNNATLILEHHGIFSLIIDNYFVICIIQIEMMINSLMMNKLENMS